MSLSQSTAQRLLGTADAFARQNPIVANGQIACETDANKFKIGDGISHYNDLPYGNQPIVAVTNTTPTSVVTQQPINIMLSLLSANGITYKPDTVLTRLILGAYNFPVGLATSPAPHAEQVSSSGISLPIAISRAGVTLATGSIDFATGHSSGSFTFASTFTSMIGDILTISTPNTEDATFGDVSVTFTLTTG